MKFICEERPLENNKALVNPAVFKNFFEIWQIVNPLLNKEDIPNSITQVFLNDLSKHFIARCIVRLLSWLFMNQ